MQDSNASSIDNRPAKVYQTTKIPALKLLLSENL
jgi:hypothetical protein